MLRNKHILLISPESWDHIFVSKHHYAVHLARRGNKVFYLGPPGDNASVEATQFKNLFLVEYKGFPRGLRFFPAFVQRNVIGRIYRKLATLCQTDFDIVWSFDNSVFFDLSALPGTVLKVSHIVDYNQHFQIRRAASTSDFCLCTSDAIMNKLARYHSEVYKINHGYNVSQMPLASISRRSTSRITALYAGNLSIPYIDWHLLSLTVDSHPEIDFLFVGPVPRVSKEIGILKSKRNVIFIGRIESDALPRYYHQADVLLVAYQERFQNDQTTNPHKMMEYMGSGRVIVATNTREYEELSPMIMMSATNAEWPYIFKAVIENLEYYNSEELRNKRRAFAMDNTYAVQIDRIEQIISRR